MSTLSSCPKCLRLVTLPQALEVATIVRCPLCQAEYPFSEALDATPPALIVVSARQASVELAEKTPASNEMKDFTLDFADSVEGEVVENEKDSVIEDSLEPNDSVEEVFDFNEFLEEKPATSETDSSSRIPLSSSSMADAPPIIQMATSSIADVSEKIPPTQTSAPDPQILPGVLPKFQPLPQRRKPKKKHPIRFLFGLFFSGGVGLLIAYYAVWLIRGEAAGFPRYDFLPFLPSAENAVNDIPLPRDKVYPKLPFELEEKPVEKPQIDSTQKDVAVSVSKTSKITAEEIAEPEIGPRSPPKFTSVDFDNASQEVTVALYGKNGTDGLVNEQSYPPLCHVAEVQAFIPANELLPNQKSILRELLVQFAKDPKQVAEIGRLAGEILKKEDASQSGILLSGKASTIKSQNGLYGTGITLPDDQTTIIVMSDQPLTFQEGDNVLIAGGVIDKPSQNLAGYKGSKTKKVIWIGIAVPIDIPST